MKKRALWLGGLLILLVLVLLILYGVRRSAPTSLTEQIEDKQDLPAGSVQLLSEDILIHEGEQVVGFFDHQGRPGLAIASLEEPPQLSYVETFFYSRDPEVWTTYAVLDTGDYLVFLSQNPDFAYLKFRWNDEPWETIPVPPPPSMVSCPMNRNGRTEYECYDKDGNKLQPTNSPKISEAAGA